MRKVHSCAHCQVSVRTAAPRLMALPACHASMPHARSQELQSIIFLVQGWKTTCIVDQMDQSEAQYDRLAIMIFEANMPECTS